MKIHDFGPGIKGVETNKELVGGKGQSLAVMTNMGINVPPGCIIDIPHCTQYWKLKGYDRDLHTIQVTGMVMTKHLHLLEKAYGFQPLLSVRSGAPVSMPGMMDTILNVGLTTKTLNVWQERIGARAAWDSYRRLILMLATTAFDVPEKIMNAPLEFIKAQFGHKNDTDLSTVELVAICESMKYTFKLHKNMDFPDTLKAQLGAAIDAVFRSWNSERAIIYRKLNNMEAVSGTAVTVQAMAFGNLNDQSGTGVLFTRNPLTGQNLMYGEYLINAQGEDVVAGIRTPLNIHEMEHLAEGSKGWNGIYSQLLTLCTALESHYKDMVDIEFTVQDGTLFVLQSRVGKRSAAAAMKIAMDMYDQGMIDQDGIFSRITKSQYKISKRPMVDPTFKKKPAMQGINASPGVAKGYAVFSATDAVKAKEEGRNVIMVTRETTPEDIAGMNAAVGILTATGGSTSHAAVVARSMDKPCVCGVTTLTVNGDAATYEGGHTLTPKALITICGQTGRVWVEDEVPVVSGNDGVTQKFLFDMISGDAYQVIDLAAVEEGLIPKNVALRIEHCLMQGISSEDITQSLAALQILGHGIMLDLSQHDMMLTKELRSIFCPDPLPKQYVLVLNEILAMPKADLINPSTVLITKAPPATADIFSKAGFVLNKPAKVLADLLGDHAIEITDDFVTNVVGSPEALKELLAILEAAGKKPKGVSKDIHPERALFTRLSG